MPLDNQGCTFTFKKLTRVPLRRRRRRSNHQKEEEETFARAMLQKKQKETTTVNRNVVVPACRGTRNRTYRSREDALKASPKQTKNTSFSFSKRERFVNAIVLQEYRRWKRSPRKNHGEAALNEDNVERVSPPATMWRRRPGRERNRPLSLRFRRFSECWISRKNERCFGGSSRDNERSTNGRDGAKRRGERESLF